MDRVWVIQVTGTSTYRVHGEGLTEEQAEDLAESYFYSEHRGGHGISFETIEEPVYVRHWAQCDHCGDPVFICDCDQDEDHYDGIECGTCREEDEG